MLTRSHALLGFYHLMGEQLIGTATSSMEGTSNEEHSDGATPASASPPTTAPTINEVYMLTPTRGFYAVRRGPLSLYVMFSEKVAQLHHAPLTWQLLEQLEALNHRLI